MFCILLLIFGVFKAQTAVASSRWVVVKIRVPFWVPMIIRHLSFRVPKKDPSFDNYPGYAASHPRALL